MTPPTRQEIMSYTSSILFAIYIAAAAFCQFDTTVMASLAMLPIAGFLLLVLSRIP